MTDQYHGDDENLDAFQIALQAQNLDPKTFAAAAYEFLGKPIIGNKITNNDHATIQRAELIVFEMLNRDINPYQINDAVFLKRLGKIMSVALTSTENKFFKFENGDNTYFQNYNPSSLPGNPGPLELREKLLEYGYHVCMATAFAGGFDINGEQIINLSTLQGVYIGIIDNKKLVYHSLGHAARLARQIKLGYPYTFPLTLPQHYYWLLNEAESRLYCILLAIIDSENSPPDKKDEINTYTTQQLNVYHDLKLEQKISKIKTLNLTIEHKYERIAKISILISLVKALSNHKFSSTNLQ